MNNKNLITGLLHQTSFDNAIKILASSSILSQLEMFKRKIKFSGGASFFKNQEDEKTLLEQYPGAYASVMLENMIGDEIKYWDFDNVIFVLCSSVLSRGDWHFNKYDSMGMISEKYTVFDRQAIEDKSIYNSKDYGVNEIVFDHSIPTIFVKEIWTKNNKTKIRLENELDKLAIKHSNIKVVNIVPNKTYLCSDRIEKMNPNMCFILEPYLEKNKTVDFYNKQAEWCGLNKKIKDLSEFDELQDLLKPIVINHLLNKK